MGEVRVTVIAIKPGEGKLLLLRSRFGLGALKHDPSQRLRGRARGKRRRVKQGTQGSACQRPRAPRTLPLVLPRLPRLEQARTACRGHQTPPGNGGTEQPAPAPAPLRPGPCLPPPPSPHSLGHGAPRRRRRQEVTYSRSDTFRRWTSGSSRRTAADGGPRGSEEAAGRASLFPPHRRGLQRSPVTSPVTPPVTHLQSYVTPAHCDHRFPPTPRSAQARSARVCRAAAGARGRARE